MALQTVRIPTVKKRPIEQFAVGLKFIAPDLEPNDVITTVEVTIEPNEIGGLEVVGSPTIDVDIAAQVIAGGVDGNEYFVRFKVTTSQGHIYEDAIYVLVRDITP